MTLMAGIMLSSCQKDSTGMPSGEGYLHFNLGYDPSVEISRADDAEVIFAVDIIDADGETVMSFPDHRQMPEQVKLTIGEYTVRAHVGSEVSAAFEEVYYAGEDKVKVTKNQNCTANIVCTLATTKVSVILSETLRKDMASCEVTVENGQDGCALLYSKDEARNGYFRVSGKLTWKIDIVNRNGSSFTLRHTVKDVKAREHYIFNFSVNEDGDPNDCGSMTDVELDEQLNQLKHNIDLILGRKPRPEFSGEGLNAEGGFYTMLGEPANIKVNIKAPAQIYAMDISHNSGYLASQGLPYSFSPIKSDPATLSAVNAMGITWDAVVDEAYEVNLDLSEFVRKLPVGTYVFTANVRDFQDQNTRQDIMVTVDVNVDVATLPAEPWALFAVLKGKWNTAQRPEQLGFKYRKASEEQWTEVGESALTVEGKAFSARIRGLETETEYIFKAISLDEEGAEEMSFVTGTAIQIPNMNFDSWTKSGKEWYANQDLSSAYYWWDSGNKGANTLSETNPTSPEESDVVSGKAARLSSTEAGGVFAAASIFTGRFVKAIVSFPISNSGAELDFGMPYTSRPLQMKGYYKYRPGTINKSKGNYSHLNGTVDNCIIYVVLGDWDSPFRINTTTGTFVDIANDPHIIGYGEVFDNRTMDAYEPFTIDINYRSSRIPKYVMVIASASRYGDYFTGSTSSVLRIDEFEFVFDPETE